MASNRISAENYLMRKGFGTDGNFIVDAGTNTPIVVCIGCGKIYNDRYTKVTRSGAHCPYCGSARTRELVWNGQSKDVENLADALANNNPRLGRLD